MAKESDVQKTILEFLEYKGFFVWRNHTTGIYNPKGRGFIPVGMTGIADILGILPDGKFLAIEVKNEKGQLTENQEHFLQKINENNGLAFMARSIEDVELQLAKGGYGKW